MKKSIVFLFITSLSFLRIVNAQLVLEPYFERLEPAQPDIMFGGMAVALAVNPSNDNEVIAAAQTGGLFKTTDHSANWNTLYNFPGGHYVNHVQYAPMNSNNIIAVTSSNFSFGFTDRGIWLSRDGGVTWEQPPSGIPPPYMQTGASFMGNCISTFPGSRRIIVGTNMGLAISNDDGITWNYQVVPGSTVNSAALMRNNVMLVSTPRGIFYWNAAASGWDQAQFARIRFDGIRPIPFLANIVPAFLSDRMASHNSFYVPPPQLLSDVTTANPVFVVGSDTKIYFSRDGGQRWVIIDTIPGGLIRTSKGTLFVKMVNAGGGLDLYASNCNKIWRKNCPRTGPDFNYDFSHGWEELGIAHTDVADMCLDGTGNPWLLAGDGGIQKFHRNILSGDNFSFDGGGGSRNGFQGLQITEIKGMYISSRREYDMYFGTQDNDLFASENRGRNWIANVCCEGFFLEHARQVDEETDALVGSTYCGPCSNSISRRLFRDRRIIETPRIPRTNIFRSPTSSPLKYINKNNYLVFFNIPQDTPILNRTDYYITRNYSSPDVVPNYVWAASAGGAFTRGMPHLCNTSDATRFVLYHPYKESSDAGGDTGPIQHVKLMRIMLETPPGGSGALSDIRFPSNTNLGSIGVSPTEFAKYEVFAADPVNNEHLIAADALNQRAVESFDGGNNWSLIPSLTQLATENGNKQFSIGRFTNLSAIAFNPDYPDLVLSGTKESGIFYSWNRGRSWQKIRGSEVIPEVTSFYFQNNNTVWVSSYGRGLWKIFFIYRPARIQLINLMNYFLQYPISIGAYFDNQRLNNWGPYDQKNKKDETPDPKEKNIDPSEKKEPEPEEKKQPNPKEKPADSFVKNNIFSNKDWDQSLVITDGTIESVFKEDNKVTGVQYSPNGSVLWFTDSKETKDPFPVIERDERFHAAGKKMELVNDLAYQGYSICGLLLNGNQLVDILYSKEPIPFPIEKKYNDYVPIGAKELDEKLVPRFTIQSDQMMAGYCYVLPGEKLMISGNRFDSQSPNLIQVFIDGEPSDLFGKIDIDKNGFFTTSALAELPMGHHSITIKQYNAEKKLIAETDEFIVMHRDDHMDSPKKGN